MPNPANQGCGTCHTAAPANYTTLAANAVLHTGIATGCATCHAAPNATPPVYYQNFTPKSAKLTPVHIPSGATACQSCHAISFTSFSGTSMSSAKHTLMFATIAKTCDQCHERGLSFFGVNNLTVRPNGHHTGQDCNGCHSTNNWGGNTAKRTVAAATKTTTARVSTVVSAPTLRKFGGSSSEPGVVVSMGRGAGALGGAGAVGGVGSTARVSHAGVVSNCFSCHNGVLASGKPAAHIASNNTCENCHTTFAWLPARFDHRGVTATCKSCHNGVSALGKPSRHVQTTQDCSACHGTIAWQAVVFSHIGINATCQSCHNGITATGKQVQHPRTTLDCGSCHNTFNWTTTAPKAPLRPLIPLIPRPRGPTNGPSK
jgi:nitrate/TMAO reductase-like tetraheme cytochrome c subunit